MESRLFGTDLLNDHEPGIPGGGTPPLYGRRDARRYRRARIADKIPPFRVFRIFRGCDAFLPSHTTRSGVTERPRIGPDGTFSQPSSTPAYTWRKSTVNRRSPFTRSPGARLGYFP